MAIKHLGGKRIQGSSGADAPLGDGLKAYWHLDESSGTTATNDAGEITGNSSIGTAGNLTLTDVTLNQGSHQAANTTGASVTLTLDGGGDPRNSFAVGDQLIGSTGGPTMEVVSITSDTEMAVKNISEQIDDDEELVVRNPLKFRIGLEY